MHYIHRVASSADTSQEFARVFNAVREELFGQGNFRVNRRDYVEPQCGGTHHRLLLVNTEACLRCPYSIPLEVRYCSNHPGIVEVLSDVTQENDIRRVIT